VFHGGDLFTVGLLMLLVETMGGIWNLRHVGMGSLMIWVVGGSHEKVDKSGRERHG
jgi:hypothetical protein